MGCSAWLGRTQFTRVVFLEAFGERAEATVESYRVIPEWRMSGVGHDVDLRVRHVGFVTINDRRFDRRIISAVGDQYGLAYLR